MGEIFGVDVFRWIVLPLLIFCARIGDVTLGTLRIIFVAKGKKMLASVLGFFEVLIWITVIGQIMQNVNNPVCFIAYASGFAMGNIIGIMVEEKLAIGTLIVRIFTYKNSEQLVNSLKEAGFGVTMVQGSGATGPVHIVYTVVKRCSLPDVTALIQAYNPKAFYSVEELRSVNAGVFPARNREFSPNALATLFHSRRR